MAKDMASYLQSMDAGGKVETNEDVPPADEGMSLEDFGHMCEHGSTPCGKHSIRKDDHAKLMADEDYVNLYSKYKPQGDGADTPADELED